MIKAVLFDLFETLVTESATRPAGVASHASELGCDRDAFRASWKALRPAVVAGRMAFHQALREITTSLGHPADDGQLRAVCDRRIRIKAEPLAHVEPDVIVMLDHLRTRNIRLGIVSNAFAEDVAMWPDCALAARLDCAVFSCQVGLAKPDPEIYREACRRLDVDVAEALFIGDGQDDELRGAEQAGLAALKALWFLRRWPHYREEDASGTTCSVLPQRD